MKSIELNSASALSAMTRAALSAAGAAAQLRTTVVTLQKALKNTVAGFDELHLAAQDTQKTTGGGRGSGGAGRWTDLPDIGIAALIKQSILQLQQMQRLRDAALDALETVAELGQSAPEALTPLQSFLQQLWQNVGEQSGWLWEQHLQPLWENIRAFLAKAGEMLSGLWTTVIEPFFGFLSETASPMLQTLVQFVADAVGSAAGLLADVIGGIMQMLGGLIDFLCGAFTGNWKKAWEGICGIFTGAWNALAGVLKGIINLLIDIINGAMNGIAAAVNGIIGAVNRIRFTVPPWVPDIGGSTLQYNIPAVTAPQIPKLAQGAVIPPNAAFLAVLGDQKNGRNLELPESLLRRIVREETASQQQLTAGVPVQVSLDGEVLYTAMENVRLARGAQIGGVFAHVI